jgi:hypothetical protein
MMLPRTPQLLDDILAAGILPDRTSPWPVDYTVPTSMLQDADPHVRLEALLVVSELPASPRAAAAIAEVFAFPANARDPWTPDAISMAGARQGPEFLGELIRRPVPGNDSLAVAGMRKAVHKIARYHGAQKDVATVVGLIAATPGSTPALGASLLNGIADGWPAESPPELSAEQRAALSAAARSAPAELAAGFEKIAVRWGMPDIFR